MYGKGNDFSLMQNFLAAPGSLVYENLSRRVWTYITLQLRRNERK